MYLDVSILQKARAMPAPYSRSSVVDASVDMYGTLMLTVQDPRDPHTLKDAMKKHKIADRSFRRRLWIAELHILEPATLQQIITTQIRASGASDTREVHILIEYK